MLSILNKLTLPTLIIGQRFCIMLGKLNKLTWLKQLQNFVTSKVNLQHGRQTFQGRYFTELRSKLIKPKYCLGFDNIEYTYFMDAYFVLLVK